MSGAARHLGQLGSPWGRRMGHLSRDQVSLAVQAFGAPISVRASKKSVNLETCN